MSKLKIKLLAALISYVILIANAFAQISAATTLQNLLSSYTTYQANFIQITYDNKGQRIQESTGIVYLMRPGKFRWETQKPNPQIVIANNNVLWVYDVLLQQVTKSSIKKSGAINPAALLTGKADEILEQFIVQQVPSRGGVVTFKLKAKSPQSTFQSVELQYQKGRLIAMLVRNNLDQINVFRFTKIKVNSKIDLQLFNFKAPPGVQVTNQ